MNNNLYIEHSNIPSQDAVKSSVLRSLIYYDIFNYPLTANELIKFSSVKLHDIQSINNALHDLKQHLLIFKFGEYYSLKNDPSQIERRKNGNSAATDILPKALKRSKFIYKFPFVRSVNISGSLSKNYFDESTDFDFFIIAEKNRIWLCRLLLTLYKKIFLFNSRKYFCINYYIDTTDLLIPDKNLFSATEIITLKNQTGEVVYKNFMETNTWVHEYFPNYFPDYLFMEEKKMPRLKKFLETLFFGKIGNYFDDLAFKITTGFLKKKYSHLKKEEFNVNLRTKKNASKHHPQGFQFKMNAF
ncbi:MAG: nucleotidyltransferase domain-containing protein [Bacteroidetes bacterium]|nr:nucleotidyltransferase domain-containing protein [Bacteroidota bacterium]